MSIFKGISSGVADARRSKKELQQPPAGFGRAAVELAASVGRTKQDLIRAAGRENMKTLDRLVRDEGSLLFAYAVKKALKEWGADLSKLPSLDDGNGPEEEWLRESIELGRQLHRLASDERYQFEVDRILEVIRAHELVAEGTGGRGSKRG